jgi:hypothetical protein
MDNEEQPPNAELRTPTVVARTPEDRKRLVPTWTKVFGWLFIIMGVSVPVLAIVVPILDEPANYAMFGLSFRGSPFHPMALLISAIILSLAISAYGLLFGRSWGLNACLGTGYLGVAICFFSTCYGIFALGILSIRLELLVQVPYLMRLHQIRPHWQ